MRTECLGEHVGELIDAVVKVLHDVEEAAEHDVSRSGQHFGGAAAAEFWSTLDLTSEFLHR